MIPSVTVSTFYKYLGIKIGIMSNTSFTTENLEPKLEYLTKAPLKPQQRLYSLVVHLIPSLQHSLTFMRTTKKFLKSLDLRLRAAVRGWLKIPKDVPNTFYYTKIHLGGLGIPQLENIIPLMKTNRIGKFCDEADDFSKEIIRQNAVPKMCKNWSNRQTVHGITVTTKKEMEETIAEIFYKTVDGRGLKHESETSAVNRWGSNGTSLLSGRDYIGAIACRGGFVHTRLRAARASLGPRCFATVATRQKVWAIYCKLAIGHKRKDK